MVYGTVIIENSDAGLFGASITVKKNAALGQRSRLVCLAFRTRFRYYAVSWKFYPVTGGLHDNVYPNSYPKG
ncbi:hypothetical protein D3C81_2247180 [compost metagenome]